MVGSSLFVFDILVRVLTTRIAAWSSRVRICHCNRCSRLLLGIIARHCLRGLVHHRRYYDGRSGGGSRRRCLYWSNNSETQNTEYPIKNVILYACNVQSCFKELESSHEPTTNK